MPFAFYLLSPLLITLDLCSFSREYLHAKLYHGNPSFLHSVTAGPFYPENTPLG
jgi:hypothetical protein